MTIFYGQEEEETEEQKIDRLFLTHANMLAESFNIKINWATTDAKKRILDFDDSKAEDYQVINFLNKLEVLMKKLYENVEVI